MTAATVTEAAWARVLDIRAGAGCGCCGDWSAGEHAALDLYTPLARRDTGPVTFGQIGQSLDGRVATVTGDARDISGPDGLDHLHRLRAIADAVIIGVGTALHDSPRLSVRLCAGPSPARVIIDPHGRLPDTAPAFADDGARRLVVQSVSVPRPRGVEVIRLRADEDGLIAPSRILSALRARGLATVLVEGGASTVAHFFEGGLLARLHVAVAPLLLGGGPPGFHSPSPIARLADAPRPHTRVFELGSDVVFDCALGGDAARSAQPFPMRPDMAATGST